MKIAGLENEFNARDDVDGDSFVFSFVPDIGVIAFMHEEGNS